MYEDYYVRQNGGEMPVFAGARHQRGHGLGSMLSGLFRRIIVPFFKNNGKTLASTALRTGMQMADDVIGGKSFKDSAKDRIREGIKTAAENINWQSGSGICRRKTKKRRRKDIFD
jgi:hypothetical protein